MHLAICLIISYVHLERAHMFDMSLVDVSQFRREVQIGDFVLLRKMMLHSILAFALKHLVLGCAAKG